MSRISLRKTCLALGGAFMLTTQPVFAQDEAEYQAGEQEEMAGVMAMLGSMFKAEPLTAEQQARLPLAQTIVGKIMPDGTMREMFDGMMGGMFGELMTAGAEAEPARTFVANQLGLYGEEISLSDEQATEIANMLDPVRNERKAKEAEMMPQVIGEVMTTMEPTMRKAMSELYAVYFNDTELADIDTFFSTPSGTAYARKSFKMSSDPRIMAATMESLPQMMEQFGAIEAKMKAATADLPASRTFAELTAQEKARVAKLTGFSVDDLEEWSSPAIGAAEEATEAAYEAAEEAAEESGSSAVKAASKTAQ